MTITILKDFTFVAAAGQSFATDWISFPSEHQNAQIAILVKSITAGSNMTATLQGTFDTDSTNTISASGALTTQVTTLTDITTGLTPMVRVLLAATNATQAVISIFLTPKSS